MTTQMSVRQRCAACLFTFFLLANVLPAAQFAGGTGTADDPYQIATAEQLGFIGSDPNLLDKHFVLVADIDLDPNLPGGKVFDRAVIAPDADPATEGLQGVAFSGVFAGGGHVISNLTIQGQSYLGLFGQVSGVVRDVGVTHADVAGSGDAVGALTGSNLGSMTWCHTTGTVAGVSLVGGVVGYNDTGRMILCYSDAAIAATGNSVGGLVGNNGGGTVALSYSTGAVSGDGYVGGLVGRNCEGRVSCCYSLGAVRGGMHIGGLLGQNRAGYVTDCYSVGAVVGESTFGGLVGSIIDGGRSGRSPGAIVGCFWDTESSGQASSAAGTGKNTAKMQSLSTFLAAGWDFTDETAHGTSDTWRMASGGYPELCCYGSDVPVTPEGSGTAQEPYRIRDANDLGAVWFQPEAHYRLEASIDLAGITWSTAVVPWFDGTFDGNGCVIRNLHVHGVGHLGLFGESSTDAVISNLTLEAVDINGTVDCVGGLVGYHAGRIVASSCSGAIIGDSYVGGLVGVNRGDIETSQVSGQINGLNTYTGGLAGRNFGRITESRSAGTVNGVAHVGGLAGCNDRGDIVASYSAAATAGIGSYVGGLVGYNSGRITGSHSTGGIIGPDHVGGLVGCNSESIATSYSSGTVNGDQLVGGLVGYNTGDSDIDASHSAGVVIGDSYVGGFAGRNDGRVTTSYSSAAVRGGKTVGGLIGYNISTLGGIKVLGSIVTCYSTGAVSGDGYVGGLVGQDNSKGSLEGIIVACFWDTETSGQGSSPVGTGNTTAQMQTASTFLDAGWDFVDETTNGTDDIWWITEGQDYPRLWWE